MRAQAERDAGVPDVPMPSDARQPFDLPLAHLGYRNLRIEPRSGYVSWRAVDADTGERLHAAALKEMLRWVASQVPRMLAARNFSGLAGPIPTFLAPLQAPCAPPTCRRHRRQGRTP